MTYYQLNHTQTEITPANFLYQGENEHKNDVYISKTLQNSQLYGFFRGCSKLENNLK